MNIGIDASRAFIGEKTGTETYSHELIRHLARIENPAHRFLIYVRKGVKVDLDLPSHFSIREIGGSFLWTQFYLSREMLKREADVLFVPSHAVPLIHPRRTAVMVHGLEFRMFPECYSLRERIILEVNTLLSINFAAKIITPSQNTKRDLVRLYGIDPEKIKVINHGVDKSESVQATKDSSKFNMLFIGRLEKRKNIIGIIRAFEEFMKGVKNSGKLEINLILAGKKGFGFEEVKKEVDCSPSKHKIILPGYVTEEEKRKLYEQADLFLFPSFYEGFGIPVLEAMSHGVPVICSNNSSLGEIAEGAALLVNPENTCEISSAISSLFDDSRVRKELACKGIGRVEKFHWEKCANEVLSALTDWQ